MIISILTAIALPSFLSQANKARLAEGRINIGSVNSNQQAFRAEKGYFATTVAELGIGIQNTENYSYEISTPNPNQQTIATATPLKNQGGVAGKVYVSTNGTPSVLCVGADNQVPDVAALTSSTQCPEP